MTSLSKTRIILYLVIIFIAGGISGAMIDWRTNRRVDRKPPPTPEHIAEHMQKRFETRLGLTPEQIEKIRPILQKTATEMKAIHRRSLDEMEQLNRKSNAEIAGELTPEQKQKLDEMEKERQEFIQKRIHRSPSSAVNKPPQC